MIRLFTALEVAAPIGRALEALGGGVPGARWIDRENYHITLSFIGDVDPRLAAELDAGLDKIDRPAFMLRLRGVGSFGRAKPHALWAGVERVPKLAELQAETHRVVARLGVPREARKFTPHVTLARLKGGAEAALAAYLARHALFLSDWFDVERFVLLSSRPAKGGGPYGLERAYPLREWSMLE
jgi:2'-5' RNA ligase